MADNANNRKKALVVSVLAFLLAGGGIFLFFVIQGSNDLTGKGKNNSFSYGEAAREGISSFFSTIGVIPDEEEILQEYKEGILATHGFLPDGTAADTDVSDWMANAGGGSGASNPSPFSGSGGSASPANVPKMAGRAGSSVGGGGAGTKSAASVTRFGGESDARTTSVRPGSKAGTTGVTEKGTLGTLKNAKALLGAGLRSDSAMTARSKWGQSFGVGGSVGTGGKTGDLAYNKSGLVGLDKIKSGEIESLKMDRKGGSLVPEAGAFERDKSAEAKDAGLQAKKEDAKAKAEADTKKAAAEAALQGVQQGAKPDDKPDADEDSIPPSQKPITQEETAAAQRVMELQQEPLSDGSTFSNKNVTVERNSDGGATFKITGVVTPPKDSGEKPYGYVFDIVQSKDGTLTVGEFVWQDGS